MDPDDVVPLTWRDTLRMTLCLPWWLLVIAVGWLWAPVRDARTVFSRREWVWLLGTWLTAWLPTLMFLATFLVFLWLVWGGPPPTEAP